MYEREELGNNLDDAADDFSDQRARLISFSLADIPGVFNPFRLHTPTNTIKPSPKLLLHVHINYSALRLVLRLLWQPGDGGADVKDSSKDTRAGAGSGDV